MLFILKGLSTNVFARRNLWVLEAKSPLSTLGYRCKESLKPKLLQYRCSADRRQGIKPGTQIHTPPWYKGRRGLVEPLPRVLIFCSISKRFCIQWKVFDLLYKMRCIFAPAGISPGRRNPEEAL